MAIGRVKTLEWTTIGVGTDPIAADAALLVRAAQTVDLSDQWPTIRSLVLQSFRDNFTSSARADGTPWPPRKGQTSDGFGGVVLGAAPSKRDDGHPLLIETGALLQAATGGGAGHITRIAASVLEVGIDKSVKLGGIPGAQAHDRGRGNLPEREFHNVREEHLQEIDGLLLDAIGELL